MRWNITADLVNTVPEIVFPRYVSNICVSTVDGLGWARGKKQNKGVLVWSFSQATLPSHCLTC